jgi:hypothetical protein
MQVPLVDMLTITANADLRSGLVLDRSEAANEVWRDWLKRNGPKWLVERLNFADCP